MDTDGYLAIAGLSCTPTGVTAAKLESRGLPTAFRVRDGLGRSIDSTAEQWILDTASARGLRLRRQVGRSHATGPADALARCKPYMTSTTDFSDWNGQWWTSQNNCYNYGSNHRTDTFAQPGRGSGDMYDTITVPEILRVSLNDGYVQQCASKKAIHVGFAIIPGGHDYHWWRRTQPVGGQVRWCHKPGGRRSVTWTAPATRSPTRRPATAVRIRSGVTSCSTRARGTRRSSRSVPIQVRLTLAAFGLLVLVACGTSDAGDSPDVVDAPDIEVVVDMMSGVPNPRWTATGSDAAALST